MYYYNLVEELNNALPFKNCSPFSVSELTLSSKNKYIELLENNNFSLNMIKHHNEISKNNYTCYYYNDQSISALSKQHHADALKLIHFNIGSYQKNGACFLYFLKCLHVQFDAICLTETRETSIGIIDKEFHDFHIYIDNPETAKGGAVILIRKNKFTNIKELDLDESLNLKHKCLCTHCQIENKWISLI